VRLHPAVRDDLARIAEGLARHSGREVALAKLDAIAAAIRTLARTPHKGTIRDKIAPRLRAIPAARRGVAAFTMDDATRRVLVMAVGCAGSDWVGRAARLR
jgi:plasmid stabilization system protein ParE